MILILIAELAVAGVTFTNRNQLKDLLEKGMVKSFEKRNSSLTREAWDDIEVSVNIFNNIDIFHLEQNILVPIFRQYSISSI